MKWIRWTMLLLVLVIAGSAAAAFYFVFMGGRTIPMPAVEGMMSAQAVETIQKAGLLVRIDQVTSQLPSGTVVSQWPGASEKVARGRLVILKVSRGGEKKPLPDVRGMEFNEAKAKLAEAGFQVGDVLRLADPQKPAGSVLAQSPAAPAMVPLDTRVDLLVSRGTGAEGGPVAVPDVVGKQEAAARSLVEAVGLGVEVRYLASQATAPGIVVSTVPRTGAQVPAGSRIALTVATAPNDQAKPPAPSTEEDLEAPPRNKAAETKQEVAPEPTGAAPRKATPEPEQKATAAQAPAPKMEAPVASPQAAVKTEEPRHTAKVRYQVPPLSRPLPLKIEVVDPEGTRTVLEREVKGGESIAVNVPYVREAAVTVYLGGEFVWQDRYRP
ncbi:MAG: PASTA domain-containing protein [Synergistaceae bacterium]|nr:PASTA domain-containing protein [Synergistaceae bacterium]